MSEFENLLFEVLVPAVEFDGLDVFEGLRCQVHSLLVKFGLLVVLLGEGAVEIPVKVVANDEERESYDERGADLLEKSETAVRKPDWSGHKVIDLPAEMNHSVCCTSDRMNLTRFVVFACCCSKLELLLDGHSSNDLLGHASGGQVIVPCVAIQEHHANVEANEEDDQIGSVSKVLIFLVLHEGNDFVDDHWVAHVNEAVRHDADSGIEKSILEGDHDCQENVLAFLFIEDLLDLGDLVLDQVVFAETTQIFHCQLVLLRVLNTKANVKKLAEAK